VVRGCVFELGKLLGGSAILFLPNGWM